MTSPKEIAASAGIPPQRRNNISSVASGLKPLLSNLLLTNSKSPTKGIDPPGYLNMVISEPFNIFSLPSNLILVGCSRQCLGISINSILKHPSFQTLSQFATSTYQVELWYRRASKMSHGADPHSYSRDGGRAQLFARSETFCF